MSGLSCNNIKIYKGVFFILMLTQYACRPMHQPLCIKEGRHYGNEPSFFIEKWSDYYIRALSYMEGECYDAALSDLQAAMKQNPQDSRTERYYGMRFMSYFPHREAGIIYYLTDRFAEAKKELRISLSQQPTVKTSYYLQKTLKQILLNQDISPTKPTIQINFPVGTDYQTNQSALVISGIVRDSQAVSAIHISNKSVPIVIPESSIQFSQQILLNHGDNIIQVKATNILDQDCIKTIHIRRDQSGPLILVKQFHVSYGFQCDIVDPAGVDRIKANGNMIEFTKDSKVSFHLNTNGLESMKLIVFDSLGNSTEAQFHIQDFNYHSTYTALNQSYLAYMSDGKDNIVVNKPDITLSPHLSECTAYENFIDLKGKAASKLTICDLIIQVRHAQSKPLMIRPLKNVDSRARVISFHEAIPLELGKNSILISVVDINGKSAQKQLTINREVSEVFKLKYRMGFECHPLISGFVKKRPSIRQLFTYIFSSQKDLDLVPFPEFNWFHSVLIEKISRPERFRVFLSKELKNMITDWHQENHCGFSQQSSQPFYLLMGDIFITNQGVEVVLKIVQKESSTIVFMIDDFSEIRDVNSLTATAKKLSDQLHTIFPLVKGNVSKIENDQLKVTFDKNANIRFGQQLIIYHKQLNNRHNFLCPSQYNTEFISLTKVRQLNDNFCTVKIDNNDFIQSNTWAVTQ
ncbi:hypothetical protein MHK_000444 [Candidatus Magnetomorum sp. HK-1]|nr:hypothetical protein MHK_000444 [Candidatus Magnetomorum sp. HK-1]